MLPHTPATLEEVNLEEETALDTLLASVEAATSKEQASIVREQRVRKWAKEGAVANL